MTRWTWAWAANTGLLWLIVFYGRLVDPDVLLLGGYVWATWFVAQEAFGIWRNVTTGTSGRTWSEWNERWADMDEGDSLIDRLTGWDAFVLVNVLMAAYLVGYVVAATWGLLIGTAVGALVAMWLYTHWQENT